MKKKLVILSLSVFLTGLSGVAVAGKIVSLPGAAGALLGIRVLSGNKTEAKPAEAKSGKKGEKPAAKPASKKTTPKAGK